MKKIFKNIELYENSKKLQKPVLSISSKLIYLYWGANTGNSGRIYFFKDKINAKLNSKENAITFKYEGDWEVEDKNKFQIKQVKNNYKIVFKNYKDYVICEKYLEKNSPISKKSKRKSPKKPKRKLAKKSKRKSAKKSKRKSPKKSKRKSPKKRPKTAALEEPSDVFTHSADNTITMPGIQDQCFEYDGKYIYINPESVNSVIEEGKLPIFIIDENQDKLLEPGIYTWVYGNALGQPKKLYVMKCITTNETTNKHLHILKSIIDKYNKFNLIGAGELKVDNTHYIINGLSGTFMADVEPATQIKILREVSEFLNNAEIDSSMNTFINVENLPFTEDRLIEMLNLGIGFIVYNTKSECKKALTYKRNRAKWESRISLGLDPGEEVTFPEGKNVSNIDNLRT